MRLSKTMQSQQSQSPKVQLWSQKSNPGQSWPLSHACFFASTCLARKDTTSRISKSCFGSPSNLRHSKWETHSMIKLVSSLLSWKILSFSKGVIKKMAWWGPREKCKQLLNFHVCSWSWLDIVCGRGGGFDLPNKGSFGGRFFGFCTIFSVFSGNRKWSRDQGRRTKRPLNSSQIILKKLGN